MATGVGCTISCSEKAKCSRKAILYVHKMYMCCVDFSLPTVFHTIISSLLLDPVHSICITCYFFDYGPKFYVEKDFKTMLINFYYHSKTTLSSISLDYSKILPRSLQDTS